MPSTPHIRLLHKNISFVKKMQTFIKKKKSLYDLQSV